MCSPAPAVCGVPHPGQNREPGGIGAPHCPHVWATVTHRRYTLPFVGRDGRRRPQGRLGRWLERIALGAVMGAVAFVAERRLLKVIRRRGQAGDVTTRPSSGRHDVELALPTEEVDHQASGEQAADDPQHRR